MTFEELTKANASIKTMPIQRKDKKTGRVITKDYAEVNQRVKVFRMLYPAGCIETEMLSCQDGVVIFKASARDDDGRLLGTGTAYEKEGSTLINQTSYIENCETSAVGRALAMCGIGIDLSMASYEEVATAMLNQKEDIPKVEGEVVKEKDMIPGYPNKEEMIAVVKKHYPEGTDNLKKLLENMKAEKVEDLKESQLAAIYNKFGGR